MSTRRCGVAGSPIAHSLSPSLHRAAYDALGLDWTYDAHEVDAASLPAFVEALSAQWRGLSLTMPLKHAVLAHCTEVSETARQVSAVNTVVIESDGRRTGHNTDVPGLVAALGEAGFLPLGSGATPSGVRPAGVPAEVVVLGAGATARSALAALAQVGAAHVTVLARSPERAEAVRTLLSDLELDGAVAALSSGASGGSGRVDLVVATVPAPAQTGLVASPAVRDLLARTSALFDVAYGTQPTALIDAARAAGVPCADGFGLLLHQAALQVQLMTGCVTPPLEEMRSAGTSALHTRLATEHSAGASSEV